MRPMMKKLFTVSLALCLMAMSLFACSTTTYRSDLTSAEVMESVLAAIPAEAGYKQVSEGYINASTWGETYTTLLDKVVDHRIVISGDSDMNIDEVGVFRVKDAADVDTLAAMVEVFVNGQTQRHESLLQAYNPGEIPKLEEAEVKVCGTYIFYSILSAAETDKAQAAFASAVTAE